MESLSTQLNRMLWGLGCLQQWFGDACVKVSRYGTLDERTGNFLGAEIELDGKIYRGTVFFCDPGNPTFYSDDAVLQVVPAPSNPVRLMSGDAVCQLVVRPPQETMDFFTAIIHARDNKNATMCSRHIEELDDVRRVQLFLRLFVDRARRKYESEMKQLLDESMGDWNYAMYVTLFRAAGGSKYKKPYVKLAKTVPYTAVAHEKGNPVMVEALLLGGSGLLSKLKEDAYTIALKKHFDYLCRKYDIVPMRAAEWDAQKTGSDMPYGFPALRIAQLTGFLVEREFIFDSLLSCRTPKDVYRLFSGEASQYWAERYNTVAMRMGTEFMDRMGINFVVPLLFAYGAATGDDELVTAAQNLIDGIDAENNKITRQWAGRGVQLLNACDSQAVIELSNEYCAPVRCASCPVCVRLVKQYVAGCKPVEA